MNKVLNYNLSYFLLLDAITQFEDFVPGGGINNSLFSYIPAGSAAANARLKQISRKPEPDLDKFSKVVLDRTSVLIF